MIQSSPFATLQQITSGYILSRCPHVIADLGVADVLDETPRTATELAASVDTHPGTLADRFFLRQLDDLRRFVTFSCLMVPSGPSRLLGNCTVCFMVHRR